MSSIPDISVDRDSSSGSQKMDVREEVSEIPEIPLKQDSGTGSQNMDVRDVLIIFCCAKSPFTTLCGHICFVYISRIPILSGELHRTPNPVNR